MLEETLLAAWRGLDEFGAAHQHRLAACLERREVVALAGHEGRVGELDRPPIRGSHTAVETQTQASSDRHLFASLPQVPLS